MSTDSNTSIERASQSTAAGSDRFPAYGPVDAVLGLGLFFVVLDRATPTAVTVLSDTLDVSPSLVGLGLAALFWFVVAVTLLDQGRRQLVALGVVTGSSSPASLWARSFPDEVRLLFTLAVFLFGTVIAAWTAGSALETVVTMLRVVVTLDTSLVTLESVAVMIVFFAAFGLAATALDRLAIDGLRTMLGE